MTREAGTVQREEPAPCNGRNRKDHPVAPHRYQIGVSGWSQSRFKSVSPNSSGDSFGIRSFPYSTPVFDLLRSASALLGLPLAPLLRFVSGRSVCGVRALCTRPRERVKAVWEIPRLVHFQRQKSPSGPEFSTRFPPSYAQESGAERLGGSEAPIW